MNAILINCTRLNLRLIMIALILVLLPAAAFANCSTADTLDYVTNASADGNYAPIALRPEEQPACTDTQQNS